MEKKGRNGSRITCYYNKFNHTQVIATRGNYQLMTFMSIFWPILVIICGFSLMKYVKHLQPAPVKTTTEDRKRILVLSTLTAFLRSEGQPAVYHSPTMPGSRNISLVQFSMHLLIELHVDAFELLSSCYHGTSFICGRCSLISPIHAGFLVI